MSTISRRSSPLLAHIATFLRQAEATGCSAWLISSNPFDVIGAISAGMKSAGLRRSPEAVFDPWKIDPTITVKNLLELDERISD